MPDNKKIRLALDAMGGDHAPESTVAGAVEAQKCCGENLQLILVGDCLKKYKKKGIHVEGCPPGEPAPHWAIVDRMAVSAEEVDLTDPEITKIIRARMEEEAFPFIEHMIKLKEEWDSKHNQ